MLLLKDGDSLPIGDKLPVLSLDYAVELAMDGVILKHTVAEDNGRVTDGNSSHFARVERSPGNQVPSTANLVTPTFTAASQRQGWHSIRCGCLLWNWDEQRYFASELLIRLG